jgi:tetratricopeptide (TPR) repeat protein
LHRKTEAIREYREVVAQQPDLVPARFNLGTLLLEQGNIAEAAEHLRVAVDKQPDHWAATRNLADAYASLGQVPEAKAAFEKALQLKNEDAPSHLAYAKLLQATDLSLAEEHARRALQLEPTMEEALFVLAGILEGRFEQGASTLPEAANLYQQYLASHPERADVRLRLASVYLELARYADAVQVLESAREQRDAIPDPARALEVNRALVRAYLEMKQVDKALALLPELMTQEPQNAEWPLLWGTLLMGKKQYAEAAAAFQRATQLDAETVQGYTNLASALYLLKDYQGTVAALEKVSALGKDTPGSFFLRAITLDRLGQKEPALENYRKFLESDGNKDPDQEFQARQRVRILTLELR